LASSIDIKNNTNISVTQIIPKIRLFDTVRLDKKKKEGKEKASALNSHSESGFPAGDGTAGNYFYFCHSRENIVARARPTQ